MDADKVIEWITHAMAIELTTHQENMIRLHCDGGDMSYRSYARGGYKFAEVMVRAYREAEEGTYSSNCGVGRYVNEPFDDGDSYTCDMGNGTYLVAHRVPGMCASSANYDEAHIPDHVSPPDVEEKSMEHDEMPAVRSMVDAFDILKYFVWEHLPDHLQKVSRPFYVVALDVAERGWVNGADDETNVALRKLLEAKDAAVRAVV
jgi:hypothetical protein